MTVRIKVTSENILVGTLFLSYFQGNLVEPYFIARIATRSPFFWNYFLINYGSTGKKLGSEWKYSSVNFISNSYIRGNLA
jgi:hypothetical protein